MAIEDVGCNPERLAAAIHDQLGLAKGPVPVAAIAAALDIVEIRTAATRGLEGALVTTEERSEGIIMVRAGATSQRRRFTVGHELGHFLNPEHKTTTETGFACTEKDLATPWPTFPDVGWQRVQEAEASRFAIELLAPRRLIRPTFLRGTPDLEKVLTLSGELDISREAGARRWLELHNQPIALVFGRDGLVRYVERSPEFPVVTSRKGDRLPPLPGAADNTGLSHHEEADWRDWLRGDPMGDLVIQALHQREGFTITVLSVEMVDADS
ncbi:MAG: ImmA/IrrE family metallo-endopeptidase [Microvirga sp.]